MDILEIIKARHSVRQYKNQKIEEEKRKELLELADLCNKERGLNIQIIFDEPKCFNSLMSKITNFKGCENYIAIVGKKNDKDLEEKTGYYGEKIVLKAQELGLNTCWVALTHGKSIAKVEKDEKQVILIALGYGVNQGFSRKSKSIADVSNVTDNLPEWYKKGIEAALLAPTAVNQQKFYFTLENDTVKVVPLKGPNTKIDLGIVKYHFEVASGHKVQ